jgi:sec-independent protein translocase protein TatA
VITNAIIPLFLSDISGTEVLVIFLFILIFFGSKSIPTMARTFGRAMREIRNASADLQNEIKKSGLDVKSDLNLSAIIQKTEEEIEQPLDQVMVDIKETGMKPFLLLLKHPKIYLIIVNTKSRKKRLIFRKIQ